MTASYRLDSAHDEFITMDESLTSVDNATDRARVLFRDMVRRLGLGDAVEFLPAALHPEEEQELLAILGESISTEEK